MFKRVCRYCGETFESSSPVRTYCYKRQCEALRMLDLEVKKRQYHYKRNEVKRREWRQKIQDLWGRDGKNCWKKAEELAAKILEQEGYTNIVNLSKLSSQSPFDYFAIKDGKRYVFQITVRTHTMKPVAAKYADLFGLEYRTIFIKHDLTRYIIKAGSSPHLSLKDIDEAKEVMA